MNSKCEMQESDTGIDAISACVHLFGDGGGSSNNHLPSSWTSDHNRPDISQTLPARVGRRWKILHLLCSESWVLYLQPCPNSSQLFWNTLHSSSTALDARQINELEMSVIVSVLWSRYYEESEVCRHNKQCKTADNVQLMRRLQRRDNCAKGACRRSRRGPPLTIISRRWTCLSNSNSGDNLQRLWSVSVNVADWSDQGAIVSLPPLGACLLWRNIWGSCQYWWTCASHWAQFL